MVKVSEVLEELGRNHRLKRSELDDSNSHCGVLAVLLWILTFKKKVFSLISTGKSSLSCGPKGRE